MISPQMSQQTEIQFNKLISFLCIRPPPFLRCIKESKNMQNRRNESERGEVQAEQEKSHNENSIEIRLRSKIQYQLIRLDINPTAI